jgi:Holliday junction resolvasome RuvABC endonuclease subunit
MIFGIDPSLNKSGVSQVDREKGHAHQNWLITPNQKWQHTRKFAYIADQLKDALDSSSQEIEAVGIEKPFFGPNKLTAQFCMGVWGAMIPVIYRYTTNIIEIHPNYLKKFVTGKFRAMKDQMRLQVWKRWMFEHDSMDIVEAYACAMWVRCHLDPKGFSIKSQETVKNYLGQGNAGFLTGDE